MSSKACSKCKEIKSLDEFYNDKRAKDGKYSYCKSCDREYSRNWQRANPDKVRQYVSKWREANPGKAEEATSKWKQNNYERVKELNRKWHKDNPEKSNALAAKRRASKLQATPPWLSKEHLAEITQIYDDVQQLQEASGLKFHVDHIIPLQGENVCGLHVPWNLQPLLASDNISKSNKLIES